MTKPERKIIIELAETEKTIDLTVVALAIANKIKKEGLKHNDGRTKVR